MLQIALWGFFSCSFPNVPDLEVLDDEVKTSEAMGKGSNPITKKIMHKLLHDSSWDINWK